MEGIPTGPIVNTERMSAGPVKQRYHGRPPYMKMKGRGRQQAFAPPSHPCVPFETYYMRSDAKSSNGCYQLEASAKAVSGCDDVAAPRFPGAQGT